MLKSLWPEKAWRKLGDLSTIMMKKASLSKSSEFTEIVMICKTFLRFTHNSISKIIFNAYEFVESVIPSQNHFPLFFRLCCNTFCYTKSRLMFVRWLFCAYSSKDGEKAPSLFCCAQHNNGA